MAFFGDSKKCVFSDNSTCKNQHMQKSAHAKISKRMLSTTTKMVSSKLLDLIYTGFILNLDLIFFFQNTTGYTHSKFKKLFENTAKLG